MERVKRPINNPNTNRNRQLCAQASSADCSYDQNSFINDKVSCFSFSSSLASSSGSFSSPVATIDSFATHCSSEVDTERRCLTACKVALACYDAEDARSDVYVTMKLLINAETKPSRDQIRDRLQRNFQLKHYITVQF